MKVAVITLLLNFLENRHFQVDMKTILLLFLFLGKASTYNLPNVVKTASDIIIGRTVYHCRKPVQAFLGVPFAEPPVGPLRFKKPVPVKPKRNFILALWMPSACLQYNPYSPHNYPWNDILPGKSEDCLYLNAWVPDTTNRVDKLPVMIWLYGGAMKWGSNRIISYDGHVLAAEQDVVVIVPNFRLGVFGFFTSATEDAPGNMGLHDALEAIKWVNRNIDAFGGDIKRITLFGQSSGAIMAGLLCLSPPAEGLFQKVIMESGAPTRLDKDPLPQNMAYGQKLAEVVGCATDSYSLYTEPQGVVECLRGLKAADIQEGVKSFDQSEPFFFEFIYGDQLLPPNPRRAVAKGRFHNVDLMIGFVNDEGAYQLILSRPDIFGAYGENSPRINQSFGESLILNRFDNFPSPTSVVQHYLDGSKEEEDYTRRSQVYHSYGDFSYVCPSIYFAESYAIKGNPVYFYNFVHRPSNTIWAPWVGVTHQSEVDFVFGRPLGRYSNYTESENTLSKQMMKFWSNFAKEGNPGLDWPRFSRESPFFKVLKTTSSEECDSYLSSHIENCNFFRCFFGFP